jgi:hypothetical protein
MNVPLQGPAQTYAQLPQGARHEGRPRNTARVRSLFTEVMQKLHRWLADPSTGLHGEKDETVAFGNLCHGYTKVHPNHFCQWNTG